MDNSKLTGFTAGADKKRNANVLSEGNELDASVGHWLIQDEDNKEKYL